jgi:hypothetical protein
VRGNRREAIVQAQRRCSQGLIPHKVEVRTGQIVRDERCHPVRDYDPRCRCCCSATPDGMLGLIHGAACELHVGMAGNVTAFNTV